MCERTREQKTGDRTRRVVRYLDYRRECTDAKIFAAGRDQRMDIDDRLASVEFVPYGFVRRIAEPLVAVVGLQADAIRLQRIEGIFDFLERRVDVEHGQRREQSEAARIVAHHFGAVVVAYA